HGDHDVGVGLIGEIEHGGGERPGMYLLERMLHGDRARRPEPSDATFEPDFKTRLGNAAMAKATLSISSRNYSSWCLRGWLLCKLAGLDFEEEVVSLDDPSARAELLLLSPSFLVPCLTDTGVKVWDTLAIAEYLAEAHPNAGLLPTDRAARAHCRAI